MRLLLSVALLVTSLLSLSQAEVKNFPVMGFTITQEITLPVFPDSAYDMMTGDISGWWDHSMSDHPAALFIEPKPGGGFWEYFDKKGKEGVRHAVVTYAQRGKRLRFEGALGLAGMAVQAVTTYDFESAPLKSTKLTLTVNIIGQIDEDLAQRVDGVWHHFLVERLQPYVEKRLKH